jgi:hypothetical protein
MARTFRPHSNPRHRGIKWTSFGACCWCFASACVVLGRHQLPVFLHTMALVHRPGISPVFTFKAHAVVVAIFMQNRGQSALL